MMKPALLALAFLPLALAGCHKGAADTPAAQAKAAAPVPPPPGQNWTDIVSATPEGGFRMGNPNAPVQIVEYGSFTCPHCKAFAAEGGEALQKTYIPTGRVSWEFRPFLIHSPDAAVSLLVQCRGAQPFFKLAEQVYAAQDEWLNKLVAVPAAEQERWQTMAPVDQFQAIATKSGLKGFLAARGLSSAEANKCLADPIAPSKLVGIRDHATNDLQVNGTPAFFINGQQQQDVYGWTALEPKLKAALG